MNLFFVSQAQLEAQKVAARFQEISQQYQAAKDSIELAEQEVIKDREKLQSFDPALQDKLNQATIKVTYFVTFLF